MEQLWVVTRQYNVLRPAEWKLRVHTLLADYQSQVVRSVGRGFLGNEPGVPVWTFSSALMYSLTIFTTIGR